MLSVIFWLISDVQFGDSISFIDNWTLLYNGELFRILVHFIDNSHVQLWMLNSEEEKIFVT